MRFHEIPWGSMRFYKVSANQSVPTEANRGLTSYMEGGTPSRSITARSSEEDASILRDGCVGGDGSRGLLLSSLRTQLKMELPALLNRVRLLGTRASAADCRIMALSADFAAGVCERRHGKMAWVEAAYLLVLAVTALVLHKLAGGFVKGGRSWLKRTHLDKQLKLGWEQHSKGEQHALFW
jgi:hypothetical protein